MSSVIINNASPGAVWTLNFAHPSSPAPAAGRRDDDEREERKVQLLLSAAGATWTPLFGRLLKMASGVKGKVRSGGRCCVEWISSVVCLAPIRSCAFLELNFRYTNKSNTSCCVRVHHLSYIQLLAREGGCFSHWYTHTQHRVCTARPHSMGAQCVTWSMRCPAGSVNVLKKEEKKNTSMDSMVVP